MKVSRSGPKPWPKAEKIDLNRLLEPLPAEGDDPQTPLDQEEGRDLSLKLYIGLIIRYIFSRV